MERCLMSNQDCDGDGKLDRHYGFTSYVGSGAWETNHQSGVYTDASGKDCKWTYFCKIVAVPADATLGLPNNVDVWGYNHLTWYAKDKNVIGYEIWGEFATIQEVNNDPCAGYHGILYKSFWSRIWKICAIIHKQHIYQTTPYFWAVFLSSICLNLR